MKAVILLFSVFLIGMVAISPARSSDLFNRPSHDKEQSPKHFPPVGSPKKKENTPEQAQPATPAEEETTTTKAPPATTQPVTLDERTKVLQIHLKDMSQKCPKTWETQACLASMAESNRTLASLYAEDLDKSGHGQYLAEIKEHCAASTAASQIEVPAYAMKSAMTECSNTIYDLTEKTQIKPPMSHYQLLITTIYCLDKDPRCQPLEETLLKIK